MAIIRMTREVPEVSNGPTSIDVSEQDVKTLQSRGWIAQSTEKKEAESTKKEEIKQADEPEKESKAKKNKVKE